MNITLPAQLAKRLDRVANKSGFIARAVLERLQALEKAESRRRLIRAYKEGAKDEEDWREFKAWEAATIEDGIDGDDW